ncbi:NAD(P)/FAD-dependent oxidoreductase [Novosphingobium sp.]|uniref:flavin-containing monooxygenase n=1 Tax=Novosphingobium sp. TaxID=1874826 RepID=UPI0022C1DDF5|nr:NAD(P)/FAD-dependent oxidoreductase [Novosphingobium sp.]MCZ8019588.1 NAD(P)/FAD-dependent oxidoreductase [Novosphingobium sp.]MCZ8035403.1 NAD(P)/FAD-dependent oxidoreductase [Novosphingobium sp.]MCZ8050717.1 NAD(P)/FAD-dependent oxidoreductase [Novosphingobium sp.]MCZ8059063.1 NAD(P)/FAD-dependent oxidoreductase [Novosphingobium sp.]MCZ8232509.1 NAD(P)/FAD-dependent oxidoreductase [Novosphingobium sp.]
MLDTAAIRAKYAEERDKRIRAEGNEQYRELTGKFAHLKDDPYMPVIPRDGVTDHVDFTFIGGGFAGLVVGAKLTEAGIGKVRIIDKAGDFGGNWYWNRYPGAQCDTASMIYLPLLEETGHMPSEKYAHAPEILEHSRRIGRTFGLYEHALFHTAVTSLDWDDGAGVWIVSTDRGDRFTTRHIGLGTGPLHVAKLPGIPGIERFKGHSFHTSRWDYDYTGGSPEGAPLSKLADKRVAIIGTGATAVQAVPHLSASAGTLYVCQRTPSSVDVRANAPIDPEWFASIAEPGWQYKWLDNFAAWQTGMVMPEVDLVDDGWTDLAKMMRAKMAAIPLDQRTPESMFASFEDADHEKMEQIRARTDAVVKDKETADKLKAWYRQLCKRPCFHDSYLQSFNNPNTVLLDTDGKGWRKSPRTALWSAGRNIRSIASSMPPASRWGPTIAGAAGSTLPVATGGCFPKPGPTGCGASTGSMFTAFRTCSSSSRSRART